MALFRAPYSPGVLHRVRGYAGVLAIMLRSLRCCSNPTRGQSLGDRAVTGLLLAFGSSAPLYSTGSSTTFQFSIYSGSRAHLNGKSTLPWQYSPVASDSLAAVREGKQAMRRVAIVAGSVFSLTLLS